MSEFSVIEQYCTALGASHSGTEIGVGDDAAVVAVPPGMRLAVSVDSMVEGVHFFQDAAPNDLAWKLLNVNLSDMAAMGALPKWATVTLTMPQENHLWLADFSAELHRAATQAGVQIIGGDTTRGQLNISLTIMGLLPKDDVISRSGAKPGDDLYVSGTLGDAALALAAIEQRVALSAVQRRVVEAKLHRPQAQVALGQALLGFASAGLDISDGLLGDLAHIAKASQVSVEVNADAVPVSQVYREYQNAGGDLSLALAGGDDYQLAFTASAQHRDSVLAQAAKLGVEVTCIGRIVPLSSTPVVVLLDGKPAPELSHSSYQHFD
ncbi:thiamine-monophosphate kinase [Arenicella chitinivorans]|uniref:Thiamine-monophosphate kinase n=1 Tax=Arenicella chitinivorans TaxID=1329800 RepID=A0A918RWE9_9GAMM|nr:thiamine-phosphate kinase [Arenicella chitinivorans]GHA15154.1 thiamine-monophosphate kinase [Arenicella chitinivorans]